MDNRRSSSGLSTILLWGLAVALLLGGVGVGFYLMGFDTQYAPGYSHKAFNSLQLGDMEERVYSLLGSPFSTHDTEPYVEWIYSAKEQRRFARDGVGRGTYTTFRFDESGRVKLVSGVRQTSASTVVFGDGQNHLGLTEAQIKPLKGSTQDEIRRQFGPPRAVYEYKAVKLLSYSRSPSSANYHLRSVGLNRAGKVVHIWREVYWD